jgi:hypothetical protein
MNCIAPPGHTLFDYNPMEGKINQNEYLYLLNRYNEKLEIVIALTDNSVSVENFDKRINLLPPLVRLNIS